MSTVPPMPVREAPQVPLVIYTLLMGAITLGFLAWWALTRERKIGPALPLLLLGGAFSGFMEPWLDSVVLVGWPEGQVTPAFYAFDRSVPMFVVIGYAWFCGGLLYVVARSYDRGLSTRKIWALYGAVAVVDFVAIGLSSWLGILEFFGNPPMKVLGFPIWWAAIDALDVVLGGSIVFLLMHRLRGRRQLWLVLVPSVALGAAAGIVGWPISTALNSSWPMPTKYACALASIGLSVACVHLISRVVPAAGVEQWSREATGRAVTAAG